MKIRPISDLVFIRLDQMEDTFGDTAIVRPDVAKSRPMWGTVVAVGSGKQVGVNEWIKMEVGVGDRVCVPWRTGADSEIDGVHGVIVRYDDIMAIETE
jgi:co-chaperonin GroES (HSP10)